jgi:hypothetical protein
MPGDRVQSNGFLKAATVALPDRCLIPFKRFEGINLFPISPEKDVENEASFDRGFRAEPHGLNERRMILLTEKCRRIEAANRGARGGAPSDGRFARRFDGRVRAGFCE